MTATNFIFQIPSVTVNLWLYIFWPGLKKKQKLFSSIILHLLVGAPLPKLAILRIGPNAFHPPAEGVVSEGHAEDGHAKVEADVNGPNEAENATDF